MKQRKEKTIIIHKGKQTKSLGATTQTQRIREETNIKIRELGNKYYLTKSLIERVNIKRDDLFFFGKQLENEYKEVKKGIHLKNQNKRMKESLYCWFACYFFGEIFENDSIIVKRMIQIANKSKNTTKFINPPIKTNSQAKKQSNKSIQDIKQNDTKKIISFNEIETNQEIDSFDFSNMKINNDLSSASNSNFDYDILLNLNT